MKTGLVLYLKYFDTSLFNETFLHVPVLQLFTREWLCVHAMYDLKID